MANCDNAAGCLIVLEGGDGCGKTTQLNLLYRALIKKGYRVKYLAFPDRTTPVGSVINNFLRGASISPQAAHLLFSANRWEKSLELSTWLKDGYIVILDRYYHSGQAYSMAQGLDMEWCTSSDVGLPIPDMVIYLQLSAQVAMERLNTRNSIELYEKQDLQESIIQAYGKLMDDKWEIINAHATIKQVHSAIMYTLAKVLPTYNNAENAN